MGGAQDGEAVAAQACGEECRAEGVGGGEGGFGAGSETSGAALPGVVENRDGRGDIALDGQGRAEVVSAVEGRGGVGQARAARSVASRAICADAEALRCW